MVITAILSGQAFSAALLTRRGDSCYASCDGSSGPGNWKRDGIACLTNYRKWGGVWYAGTFS